MSDTLTENTMNQINKDLSRLNAAERIAWGVKRYPGKLTFACSFGAEDMVVLDLLLAAAPGATVFVLDTGRLHQETYDLMEAARKKYGREFTIFAPRTTALETLLSQKGPNSFYSSIENRRECCHIRKVEPLSRALADAEAWITGLRRDQAVTRTVLDFAELDSNHCDIMKLNPIADWTEEQVWRYIRENNIPFNALHEKGFPSIGCAPCTRAVAAGEDLRAGRWWWESPEHKECGLHPGKHISERQA